MYAPEVIDQLQQEAENKLGKTLHRYSQAESWERQESLEKIWDQGRQVRLRELLREEQEFILNERILCSLDFRYWCRYAWIIADGAMGGGLQRFKPNTPQQLILDLIGIIQAEENRKFEAGESCDGILLAIPKARQVGITMLARLLLMHILTTTPHVLGVTASVDADKVMKIYERDIRILDHLPWWLKPSRGNPDIQGEHLTFDKLDSSLLYQEYSQKTSMAAGEQYPIGHMTEVAQSEYPYQFEHNYFPAIPQNPNTLHILESTPNGRGDWWHNFVKQENLGRGRWRVKFIPYYTEARKYRRQPPINWEPSEISLLHAKKVEETSPEYIGRRMMLPKEQLYWWESTREEYVKKNNLAFFLTNYASNLEESFQFSGRSIFPLETVEHYRMQSYIPVAAYEIKECLSRRTQ